MDSFSKKSWEWAVIAGVIAWLLFDSILWGIIIGFAVAYYVEDKASGEEEDGEDDHA